MLLRPTGRTLAKPKYCLKPTTSSMLEAYYLKRIIQWFDSLVGTVWRGFHKRMNLQAREDIHSALHSEYVSNIILYSVR